MNKAICIFNTYNNAQANLEGWGNLPGVQGDIRAMTRMLEKNYEIVTLIDQEDIEISILRILCQWTDESIRMSGQAMTDGRRDINRLHFHFSGHGFYNQTVETDGSENKYPSHSSQSNTPIGECLVGNKGRRCICSILQIQHLLARTAAEKITITLDCCRSLDRELGKTRERVKLIPMPKIDKRDWLRMVTIQGSCKTLPAHDINSMTKELHRVLNRHNGRIPIEKMDELVNNSWYVKGIDQLCQMEIVKLGGNWKGLYWPL